MTRSGSGTKKYLRLEFCSRKCVLELVHLVRVDFLRNRSCICVPMFFFGKHRPKLKIEPFNFVYFVVSNVNCASLYEIAHSIYQERRITNCSELNIEPRGANRVPQAWSHGCQFRWWLSPTSFWFGWWRIRTSDRWRRQRFSQVRCLCILVTGGITSHIRIDRKYLLCTFSRYWIKNDWLFCWTKWWESWKTSINIDLFWCAYRS